MESLYKLVDVYSLTVLVPSVAVVLAGFFGIFWTFFKVRSLMLREPVQK